MFLLEFPFSKCAVFLAWNGVSLAGMMTRLGTLDARPGQDVLLNEAAGLYHRKIGTAASILLRNITYPDLKQIICTVT